MSLKGFHVIFIILAVLCAFGFFTWSLVDHEAAVALGVVGMGQISGVIGVLLVIYGVWFIVKKSRKLIV